MYKNQETQNCITIRCDYLVYLKTQAEKPAAMSEI